MDIVVTCWGNVSDLSSALRGDKDAVITEQTVLHNRSEDIALGEDITLFDFSWYK